MLSRDNKTFCDRWCEILNKCFFDLMALIGGLHPIHAGQRRNYNTKVTPHGQHQSQSQSTKNFGGLGTALKRPGKTYHSIQKEEIREGYGGLQEGRCLQMAYAQHGPPIERHCDVTTETRKLKTQ